MNTPYIYLEDLFLSEFSGYLPSNTITNEELLRKAKLTTGLKTRVNWIEARTGIKERHWVGEEQNTSDLALQVGTNSLKQNPNHQVKNLLLATTSGDFPSPPTASIVQNGLGLNGGVAFDIGAACAGLLTAITVAASMDRTLEGETLIIASDIRSRFLKLDDLNTSPLFGDGASATILSSQPNSPSNFKIISSQLFTDGAYAKLIFVNGRGSAAVDKEYANNKDCLVMTDGAQIFLKAREVFTAGAKHFLDFNGLSINDINYIIPHQANLNILNIVEQDLGTKEGVVYKCIDTMGNTSGASIGLAFSKFKKEHKIKTGEKILLMAAGGGGIGSFLLLEKV